VRSVAARGDDLHPVRDAARAGKSGDRLERRVAVGLVLGLPAQITAWQWRATRICQALLGGRRLGTCRKAGKGRWAVSTDTAAGWLSHNKHRLCMRFGAGRGPGLEPRAPRLFRVQPEPARHEPPATSKSNRHAGFWRLRCRDPDSNRGTPRFPSRVRLLVAVVPLRKGPRRGAWAFSSRGVPATCCPSS